MTHDTWHVTCDTWFGWTFSQHYSSLSLTVWEKWCFEDLEKKGHWVNQLISDGGVCRTAGTKQGRLKLDMVSPVDNRPYTNPLYHFVKNIKICDKIHVTRDMWHVTQDRWNVTHDMGRITHGVRWTSSQNFRSLTHMVREWRWGKQ